ncbi:LysR family transcriptional regulator [Kushneria phosphatilytica]|uniref:LysR family transcriptional regulator n=1 Tax=Kushneria phosphatilytica TaxID=657387 RepID=A0A1S1NZX2_9GAMM|nr:LysR family transcriptional regulator [Kushneria phosphatilytica]OHV13911.1 LysR family transcriptional regulator [Kushneria phosphatilytica]QEL10471.1 LysR family transcriptional regulator [Kushneria phosphatilytica]
MRVGLEDLQAVIVVAQAGGFREAARSISSSPSRLSDAVRRAESRLGVRLFHRTTRSVVPTDAGRALLERLTPAMTEVASALDAVNVFRDRPAGTLRLHVPVSASRLVLPHLVPGFLMQYPDIQLDIVADSNVVNIFEAGCDAGIRYEECLEQDMIAVPIGPRVQRFAVAAAPAYLRRYGRPGHPHELLDHRCLLGKYSTGRLPEWEFEKDGEVIRVRPSGPLTVSIGAAVDLAVDAAVQGVGIIQLFEQWLTPYLQDGSLEPVLEPWWLSFSGPFLYYPDRRLVPAPLRAFIEHVREQNRASGGVRS